MLHPLASQRCTLRRFLLNAVATVAQDLVSALANGDSAAESAAAAAAAGVLLDIGNDNEDEEEVAAATATNETILGCNCGG